MKLSVFLQSWGFVQAENRLHRILLIGLLATNVITAFAALRTERTVIMIPPNLTEKVEISRHEASAQTKEAWGLFLAQLLGNVTPNTLDFVGDSISPLLSSDIHREIINAMNDQINALKIDKISTSFTPNQVYYEKETNKVFVTGQLMTKGPNDKPESSFRTYEFQIAIVNYNPVVNDLDVYQGEPKTKEFLEMQKQMEASTHANP
ncbi:TraE protein [Methylomonas koyamae]|uniref:TraE protein n=1 Tax=Methylomonas koyamae TaxID=702114 RepID=A0A177NDZ8_9GAMM|nr:TraE/TraK family type IV conjugative transfer system protein [Methylomonas koyamae]OAI16288.1 TraE protein [Methylomonas koyamae]